ncbi:MAG TPA: DUF1150 family protein [Paracoccaceae bacterium]|nr:DUF1150 family protein [Paracoccaceae bacterium]HMO71587.1 DUF1150 family protein [Paracoccaceae bacterium]
MDAKYNALPGSEDRIVYVRPVAVADLPDEIRAQAQGLDTIWSVHRPDGERVALVRDRQMAFVLARQHEMVPVNVH